MKPIPLKSTSIFLVFLALCVADAYSQHCIDIKSREQGPIEMFQYKLTITPNPVRTSAVISFVSPTIDRKREILVHDWNGNEVKRIDCPLNQFSISLDVSDMPNGNYIVSLLTNGSNKVISEHMIVSK